MALRRVAVPVGPARAPVPESDLRYIANLARRVQWDARFGDESAGDAHAGIRHDIASGTLDALLWVMGVTDVAPSSGTDVPDRVVDDITAEASAARLLRRDHERDDPHAPYFDGVVDALDFASGQRMRFWWVPLPEQDRRGHPPRDEYGHSVSGAP
jgi:hypothetical protein